MPVMVTDGNLNYGTKLHIAEFKYNLKPKE